MQTKTIINTIQLHYPTIQAIYLFGSYGTEYQHPASDVDIALLLPVPAAKIAGNLMFSLCQSELVSLTNRPVDLINLRLVNTVFQHEIIQHGTILLNTNPLAVAIFEMLTMSLYQKLNEEREDILAAVLKTGRILDV